MATTVNIEKTVRETCRFSYGSAVRYFFLSSLGKWEEVMAKNAIVEQSMCENGR
jgi:hypothetical protein